MFNYQKGSIKAPVKELKKALQKLKQVIPANPILPILDNVLISDVYGQVSVLGSDLQNVLSIVVDHKSSTDNQVSLLVDFKRLCRLVSNLKSEIITFTPHAEVIQVDCAEGVFLMKAEHVSDFPKTPVVSHRQSAALEYGPLSEALSFTVNSCSYDDLRPAMTGIKVECIEKELSFVATDGHRLSVWTTDSYETDVIAEGFIIQRKTAKILLSLKCQHERVAVRWEKNNIQISYGNAILISRLIDENFPGWRAVMPTGDCFTATLGVDELRTRIALASVFSNTTTHQIALSFKGENIEVSSSDLDYGIRSSQKMTVYDADFPEFKIGFNSRFFLKLIKPFKEYVFIELYAPNRGAIIIPSEKGLSKQRFHLIMPVMLNTYD